jgi:molybdopterin-guanine dinucleotide biosynthesis protein A
MSYGAVILAGGSARRMGGADKPMLPVGGVPMLHRVLAAVGDATITVVVGPGGLRVPAEVVLLREQPAGGGPVAALAAALNRADWPDRIAILGGDLPLLTPGAIGELAAALGDHDGAVFVDDGGHEQWLCGLWRTAAVRGRVDALTETANQPLRGTLAGLDLVRISSDADLPPWFDCDTEDDLRRAEEWLAG